MVERLTHFSQSFQCAPSLSHPWVQTVLADTLSSLFYPSLPFNAEMIDLGDGDRLLCSFDQPSNWDGQRICMLLPGLTGNAESHYMLRLTRKMLALGYLCVRANYRAVGRGLGLSSKIFHAGQSFEIYRLARHIHKKYPSAKMDVVGFSIGGHLMLKMAGEFDAQALGIERVLAVSPPVDLIACLHKIETRGRIFSRYFCKRLVAFLEKVAQRNPRVKVPEVAKAIRQRMDRIIDFDEHFIAPMFGFDNALAYYRSACSARLLERIECDTSILLADDDPIVDYRSVQSPSVLGPVKLYLTHGGGHIGFIPKKGFASNVFWMDEFILMWLTLPYSRENVDSVNTYDHSNSEETLITP